MRVSIGHDMSGIVESPALLSQQGEQAATLRQPSGPGSRQSAGLWNLPYINGWFRFAYVYVTLYQAGMLQS